MAIVYRTNGAWGVGQGYNLTAAQVDGNFYDLDQRLQELIDNPPEPVNISNMTVAGTQWIIYLENGDHFGPFTLPQAAFRPPVVSTIAENTSGVYEAVLADINRYKRYAGASALTFLLPAFASVAFQVDDEIYVRQAGTGTVTIDWPTGVTVNVPDGFLPQTAGQNATLVLKNVAEDVWDLEGRLAEDATV